MQRLNKFVVCLNHAEKFALALGYRELAPIALNMVASGVGGSKSLHGLKRKLGSPGHEPRASQKTNERQHVRLFCTPDNDHLAFLLLSAHVGRVLANPPFSHGMTG